MQAKKPLCWLCEKPVETYDAELMASDRITQICREVQVPICYICWRGAGNWHSTAVVPPGLRLVDMLVSGSLALGYVYGMVFEVDAGIPPVGLEMAYRLSRTEDDLHRSTITQHGPYLFVRNDHTHEYH